MTAAGGFDVDAFPRLAAAEEGSFWFRSRNALILWAIRRYAERSDDLLEVGCGTGYVLQAVARAFPDARMTGAELFDEGLAIARGRVPSATLLSTDATTMSFDAAFDIVGAFDVLEHIEDDQLALDRIAAALRPGGLFLATVPQHPRLWSASDDEAHHVRRYRAGELEAKVRQAGLEPVRRTSFMTLLLPALIVARGAGESCEEQLRQPWLIDRIGALALALERATIRAGASLPVGSSLLLAARRPRR